MNVWLDDERPMPEGFNTHCKTADEAIAMLASGNVTLISLDHDLGLGKTGYHVAKWIEEHAANGTLKKIRLRVHTQNPVGEKNIKTALQNAERYWKMTHASMTVTEPTHIMGPNGEIIATLCPYNDGKGITLDFEYENVEVKANVFADGEIESLTINLLDS